MAIFLFPLFLIPFLLTGCGNYTEADLVCKSCKPYYVRGSWHYPQTYYEYNESGLASWYGPGFAGKPKPYGEPFDPNAITAAHKTLPLPTVVRVTNLRTKQSAIVLIDDRGPFVYKGRIIDLSVGAAKAIGSFQKGIDRVHVESLPQESIALAKYLNKYGKSGRDPSGRTWRQILDQEILRNSKRTHTVTAAKKTTTNVLAAPKSTFINVGPTFTNLQQAQQYAAMLKIQSIKNHSLVKKIVQITGGGRKFYQVRVGPFTSQKDGQSLLGQTLKLTRR